MQTKNLKKKGFTLVELVVVVAVIAVLSAILIPTIGCFVEQAKETNDMATVRLLNTALVEDEAANGTPATMTQALAAMDRKGYDIEKLNLRSTGEIYWDGANNRFMLLKGDEVLYGDNTTPESERYNWWKLLKNGDELSATYSNYLKEGYEVSGGALTISTGLDVGENTGITAVTYANDGTAKNVVIRTNGGELTVNAPLDTVTHYGKSGKVVITAVASASYHEKGEVNGDIIVTKGHVVLENNSSVGTVKVSDEAVANKVKLSNNSDKALIVIDSDNKISADSNIGESSVKIADKDAIALIGNTSYNSLIEALTAVKDGEILTLISDYRIPESTGDTVSERLIINKKITFDFGNYRIIGFNKMGEYTKNFNALLVQADTTFIAGENGGIIADEVSEGGPYAVNVMSGAKLIIKSGTYWGGGTAIQVQKGSLEIYGGKFLVHPFSDPYGYKYQINAIDKAYKNGTATIKIYGGSFYKFDPANSKSENPNGDFVAAGYRVDSTNEWYTVVPQN